MFGAGTYQKLTAEAEYVEPGVQEDSETYSDEKLDKDVDATIYEVFRYYMPPGTGRNSDNDLLCKCLHHLAPTSLSLPIQSLRQKTYMFFYTQTYFLPCM